MPDSSPAPVVLAVDPGRAKCGIAVVSPGAVLLRQIVPTPDLAGVVGGLVERFGVEALVVGAGTGSRPLIEQLESLRAGVSLTAVDEAHTSELARIRFMAENPPAGLRRLIPSFLRTPERPYDDYVAVILAERWIAQNC